MQLILILFFLFPALVFAKGDGSALDEEMTPYTPWFTGPLLAPTPINMLPDRPAIEPTITVFDTYGEYNENWHLKKEKDIWAINPLVDFQFAITDFLGIETIIGALTNFRGSRISTNFQDTIMFFGCQLLNDKKGTWIPDLRFIIQETYPTGNYQDLDPVNEGIDSTGQGSFQTGPVLAFRKLFYLPENFLSLRGSVGYLFPSTVKVTGFNTYGGGFGTRGRVRPGQSFIAFFSGEYSISQRWALAFDSEFFYQRRSRFSGTPGFSEPGIEATNGLPTFVQISFAPELEYSFKFGSGLLGGLWFTLGGKNSPAFGSAFIAYLHIF